MPSSHRTEQEDFWKGAFGDRYSSRNRGSDLIAANIALFSRMLSRVHAINSVLELGSNIGLNLAALRQMLPSASLAAVEINECAATELSASGFCDKIFHESILTFDPTETWDLVFTKGVLIHVNPVELPKIYQLLYKAAARYVAVAEYYNPQPVEIPYRGHDNKLFKRDFAGEILDLFPDLVLVDYGFVWRRDPNFPQDDLTWFLMEKR